MSLVNWPWRWEAEMFRKSDHSKKGTFMTFGFLVAYPVCALRLHFDLSETRLETL